MSLHGIETTVLDLDWDKISDITKNIKPKEFYVEEAFFFPTDRNRTEDKSTALYAKKTGITQWHSKDYPEVKECVPKKYFDKGDPYHCCLLYTSPSPRDRTRSRMPSSA